MNILPTTPDLADLDQYFADLKRWNFDIAYNSHYAYSLAQTRGDIATRYREFSDRARAEGVPCCVQVQSTVAHSQDVPFTETQRYADNQYFSYEHHAGTGKVNHFASFASRLWLDHQKDLARTFRDFGYDWIVFEEPMLHTDIPGTQDPMHGLFRTRYPHLDYPTHQAETEAYLTLQALKRDVLVEFFTELTRYAKEIGFKQVGLMPWFFAPTFENTPAETWASNCDTGRMTFIEHIDFIVVRMQPDNIYAQAMIGATGESTPLLAYYECLAHNLGKPIIMVNNPTDEHRPENNRASSLIPLPFFTRYTLAAVAAAPQGMSRHWYGKNYGEDDAHMALLTRTNQVVRRLGTAQAPMAFVFAFSGAAHVWPRPWREVWRTYWAWIQRVTEECRINCLTFFAESLADSLAHHPELRVLVLNEYFPLPPHEFAVVGEWLKGGADRHLLYIGGKDGYRWSHTDLHTSYHLRPPEMAELVGIDVEQSVEIVYLDASTDAARTAGVEHNNFLPAVIEVGSASFCRAKLREGVEVLYETIDQQVPVLTRFSNRGWFLAMALEGGFRFPLRQFLRHLVGCESADWPLPCVAGATPAVFANFTSTGYYVVSNCASSVGRLDLVRGLRCWDVDAGHLVEDMVTIELEPLSVRLFRVLQPAYRLLDVTRTITLHAAEEGPETLRLRGMFHAEIDVVLLDKPCRVTAAGRGLPVTDERQEGSVYRCRIGGLTLDDREVVLQFG